MLNASPSADERRKALSPRPGPRYRGRVTKKASVRRPSAPLPVATLSERRAQSKRTTAPLAPLVAIFFAGGTKNAYGVAGWSAAAEAATALRTRRLMRRALSDSLSSLVASR